VTTRLVLYNKALTEFLGERKVASLTEDREPRRALDDAWDGGAVKYCLEQGNWKFAQRVSEITYNVSVVPAFGYTRAFDKPTDQVKLTKLCSDEYLNQPLTEYTEEAGRYYADVDSIYIAYISDGVTYGNDLSLWPESFANVVACYLAAQCCIRLKQSETAKEALEKKLVKLLVDARSKDAIQGPTQFLPPGGWSTARGGTMGERKNRSSLIG